MKDLSCLAQFANTMLKLLNDMFITEITEAAFLTIYNPGKFCVAGSAVFSVPIYMLTVYIPVNSNVRFGLDEVA